VWLSNQYGNTGVDFTTLTTSVSAANNIPFVADPNAQPVVVTGATAQRQSVNLIDPDYKFPTVVRATLHTTAIWDSGGSLVRRSSSRPRTSKRSLIRTSTSSRRAQCCPMAEPSIGGWTPTGRCVAAHQQLARQHVDDFIQTGTSVSERVLRQRLVSVQRRQIDQRRHCQHSWFELGEHTSRIDANNPTLTRSNFSVAAELT
jgi:hypothetical protein